MVEDATKIKVPKGLSKMSLSHDLHNLGLIEAMLT